MGKKSNRTLGFGASSAIGAVASCLGEGVSYPFDYAKTRLQVQRRGLTSGLHQYKGTFDVIAHAYKSAEGARSIYGGLSPALLRQCTYGSLKLTSFEQMKMYLDKYEGISPFWNSVASGVFAGTVSSAICTPTDLLKVRMQTGDHKYNSVLSAFKDIAKQQGIKGLYSGAVPTTQRAIMITVLNLSSYDILKRHLFSQTVLPYKFKENQVTHITASLLSGVISTYGSCPFDVAKTRIMNQPIDPITKRGLKYRGALDCMIKTSREEGILTLWNGSVPSFCRNVPWLVTFFLSYEYLKKNSLDFQYGSLEC